MHCALTLPHTYTSTCIYAFHFMPFLFMRIPAMKDTHVLTKLPSVQIKTSAFLPSTTPRPHSLHAATLYKNGKVNHFQKRVLQPLHNNVLDIYQRAGGKKLLQPKVHLALVWQSHK